MPKQYCIEAREELGLITNELSHETAHKGKS
jgi:hypothetical protein